MAAADDEIDLEKARLDPALVFASPARLCESPKLSKEEKIELLQRWADDARELEIAEDEGMAGELDVLKQRLSGIEEAAEALMVN